MNVAFLCLGGNIGKRLENIAAAKSAINQVAGKITDESGIYETAAWGSKSKNNYLNQVVKIQTRLTAKKLLNTLLNVEKKLGRTRDSDKNSDRTIDIDILLFNSDIISEHGLEIPHPRMHQRNFVLKPLNDIAGEVKHPVLKKTIATLLKKSTDTLDVKKHNAPIVLKYICIEGNIGSGKTTLAQALTKKLKADFLGEEFENNPLLPLFYENKKLFAFPLEYSFLLDRFRQMEKNFKAEKKLIISDYSIYKCLWFAKNNLAPTEFRAFKKQFKIISQQLQQPDLIVYLKTNTKNLKQNIKKRGRSYEQSISTDYLNKLNHHYESGLKKLKSVKQLTINVDGYHPKLEEASINLINNFIKENFG